MVTRSVIVTGATGGIGTEIAREFARYGFGIIVILGTNVSKLHTLAEILREDGVLATGAYPVVVPVDVDLSDVDEVQRKLSSVHDRHGAMEVLVNAAGFCSQSCFLDAKPEEIENELKVNVLGLYAVTQVIARGMVEQGSGVIVNVGSLMGRIPAPTMATYSATKAAIVGFSRALKSELQSYGIRVVLVLPTLTRTAMIDGLHTFPLMQAIHPSTVARSVIESLNGDRSEFAVGWQAHLALLVDRFFPFVTDIVLSLGYHLLNKQMKTSAQALNSSHQSAACK